MVHSASLEIDGWLIKKTMYLYNMVAMLLFHTLRQVWLKILKNKLNLANLCS